MAKMVGLSRNLKLTWLNQIVSIVSENPSEQQVKAQLDDYLKYEIKSQTNIRKTREILMNIWCYENDYTKRLRAQAFSLIKQYPNYALEIHWCMMLAAYPIFADVCKLMGKIAEFQDEITLAQLKQKLFDEWGERTTLYHSIDKIIATMKSFDVIVCDKPGRYTVKKHYIVQSEIVCFMIYTAMSISEVAYYSLRDIDSFDYLFPFKYTVQREAILQDERFELNYFGSEITIGLKRTQLLAE